MKCPKMVATATLPEWERKWCDARKK